MSGSKHTARRTSARTTTRAGVLALVCLLFGAVFYRSYGSEAMAVDPVSLDVPETAVAESAGSQNYARFLHSQPQHQRMPCLLCHKRESNSPTMRFSGHIPCASCHQQQFADSSSAICTICHTNPASGAMKRFPPLRSFNVRFDHGRHLRQTNCATCHKPASRGVAFSEPRGTAGHTTCFQCHGPNTVIGGKNIGNCATCHSPGRLIRSSDWAHAYNVNFSHSEHLRGGRMNCSSCHTVLAGAARGRQVRSPVAAMHFASARAQSCASCHNDKRAFGTENFANCKRCHEGRTFRF